MNDINSNLEMAAEKILKVLEVKAFYLNRFLMQIKGLYPTMAGGKTNRLPPTLYLRGVLASLPEAKLQKIAEITARKVVQEFNACPAPLELRQAIAQATLESFDGLTCQLLYERAKDFLALQPQTQAVADQWLERVIYTGIRKLTREKFAIVNAEEWATTVYEVVLMSQEDLATFQVEKTVRVETGKKFPFSELKAARRHD